MSAAHATGVPPSAPKKPTSALHAVIAVEPVVVPVPLFVGHALGVSPSAPKKPTSALHAVLAVEPVAVPVPLFVGQGVGVPPSGPKNPALLLHPVISAEAVTPSVLEFTGQSLHAADPVADLYVFATHAVQESAGPVLPASHGASNEQAVGALDPVLAVVLPCGHLLIECRV